MDSDPFGGIVRRLAWILIGASVMEAAQDRMAGFERRHPRTLRFVRIVGGALLVLVGLFETVLSLVVLAVVLYDGEGLASLYLLVPFAFGIGITAWGVGTIRHGWASHRPRREPLSAAAQIRTCPQCGAHMHHEVRICSQCGSDSPRWTLYDGVWWTQSVEGEWQWLDEEAGLFRSGPSPMGTAVTDSHVPAENDPRPESYDVGAPTAQWLRRVFVLVLWIAGSVIAILAGVPDGYAMLLGSLLPLAAYLVHRRRRAAGRY